jgi:hypothetical protein
LTASALSESLRQVRSQTKGENVSRFRRLPVLIATVAAFLGVCTGAQAAIVTVGSPLVGPFKSVPGGASEATLLSLSLGETGAHATSPVTGAVVGWHVFDFEGTMRLRVLRPIGGTTFLSVGSSSPAVVTGLGLQTFSTSLPITAGDTVGLDLGKDGAIGIVNNPASAVAFWNPALPDGAAQPYTFAEPGGAWAFNAVVQPAPTIVAITPPMGSIKGGAAITLTGTDFEGASAVSFGSTPAKSFTVSSEGAITATAPASQKIAKVPVTVTTIAGTATSTATFAYQGCKVPKLAGKKLKAAKKKLRKAACKTGKVTKEDGVTTKTGKVVVQSPKPGKTLAPGTKVKVILG